MLTKREIEIAREWIGECLWADMDQEDIDALTDRQIERGIAKHFDGGIAGFKLTTEGE